MGRSPGRAILTAGRCRQGSPEPLPHTIHSPVDVVANNALLPGWWRVRPSVSQHGSRASFDRPIVLLDQVVEIFRCTDLDGRFAIGIDDVERSAIGAAFVDCHGLWNTTLIDRSLKETPGSNLSRSARSRKSMVLPSRSTAR
jgi:hypothetical protein